MTREEALKKLANIIFYAAKSGYMPYDTNDEMCAMNIAKKHIDDFYTSLPSNLDEAAEEYAREKNPYGYNAFKVGVEWLAEQGETIECSVDWYDGPILDFSAEQLQSAIMKAELEVGDKVVVQIRKK